MTMYVIISVCIPIIAYIMTTCVMHAAAFSYEVTLGSEEYQTPIIFT